MNEIRVCNECNTPLIEPRKGYVVCPNCGLVHYDFLLDQRGIYVEENRPKARILLKDSAEFKRLKKWDRISYSEARKIYCKSYLQAVFSKYVSKEVFERVFELVMKEIETENPQEKRNFHLEARFIKNLEKEASQPLILKIFEENPYLAVFVQRYERPKQIKKDIDSETLEQIELLSQFNRQYANYAKKIYELKKSLMKRTTAKTRAVACMAYAEKSYTKAKQSRLKDYCKYLETSYESATKLVKKMEKGG